ncbi:MAG TPA: chromate efflux transporter [Beutenbergiaceae bacterium]|nr:chromate efflux transporter [Beutenbergiaceae bacterium]
MSHLRRTAEVFIAFGRLGLTSFGGPVAHLGFFRTEFVARRRWLSDAAYADVVALCQFLPGPASSQVGMAIGWQRAGIAGLVAAWVAFTAPSAVALALFAFGVQWLGGAEQAWLAGLKAAAAGVVAHALVGMARSLTPDLRRALLAVSAAAVVLVVPHPLVQVAVIAGGAVAGLLGAAGPNLADRARGDRTADVGPGGGPRRWTASATLLTVFAGLLLVLPWLARITDNGALQLADIFYRTGALVFGGGHVVLPLLETQVVPGLVDAETFLAGYGAAQAVPGPLFTFAGYLGAASAVPPSGITGALIALVAIFLPSALLVVAVLPHWQTLRHHRPVRRALAGVNAAVVGLLAAALVDPVITQGITSVPTGLLALGALVALWRSVPAWLVVLVSAVLAQVLF